MKWEKLEDENVNMKLGDYYLIFNKSKLLENPIELYKVSNIWNDEELHLVNNKGNWWPVLETSKWQLLNGAECCKLSKDEALMYDLVEL